MIAYTVETTKPGIKVPPIARWMPLPTDEATDLALTEEQMKLTWDKASQKNGQRVKNTD